MQNSSLSVSVQGQTKLPPVDHLLEALEEFSNALLAKLEVPASTPSSPMLLNVSLRLSHQSLKEPLDVVNLSYFVNLTR